MSIFPKVNIPIDISSCRAAMTANITPARYTWTTITWSLAGAGAYVAGASGSAYFTYSAGGTGLVNTLLCWNQPTAGYRGVRVVQDTGGPFSVAAEVIGLGAGGQFISSVLSFQVATVPCVFHIEVYQDSDVTGLIVPNDAATGASTRAGVMLITQ